ncbi:PP2C family protein-serine/threonine phosphatase [Cellulomonas sp. S1-8]|uniref:PP2C family protein-serine/threonine phosphatase n=1 Tax=Cellulomonas sp. S1-8 TaxID=2904790 RepID=UPI002243E643|nr:GAF domain-containing SpoIIE family protein phosphatase [Cellulomonas sp. S1-8]UZN04629.1 SpoIIE family protein phosphatase [Cellulomonas sp. S1-8]
MAEVARALQAETDPQHTLQRMVDLAVTTVTGCDYAAVSLFAPDRIYTPAASHDVARQVDLIQYDTDQGPCLSAIRDRDMYVTGDLRTEDRWPAFATRAAEASGVRSMLSLRLFVEGDNLGALNMCSKRPDAFDDLSIAIGRLFVAHAAIALSAATENQLSEHRADRFQAQAGIAVQLQRSMITALPDMAPFTAVARYVPAVAAAEVGGDWYDALVLPSGDLLLVVGDVTGHDIAAATGMTQARSTLRALAVSYDEPPGALLTRLDETLGYLGEELIGTCAVVRVAHRDGGWIAQVATAGHPPPLLIRGDSTAYVDISQDVLLGVTRSATRRTTESTLPPGSTLLLYTDGLVEHRNSEITDGMNALRALAATMPADDLGALCDTLVSRLAPHPTDDVCLLAVHLPDATA